MARPTIGIRREDKHEYEARAPLTPAGVRELTDQGVAVVVQPSDIRAFSDDAYREAGARVQEDLGECGLLPRKAQRGQLAVRPVDKCGCHRASSVSALVTAATTTGLRWPTSIAPKPIDRSSSGRPSTSWSQAPLADVMEIG